MFKEKDHPVIAEAVRHLVTARDFRDVIVRGQRERFLAFSPEVVAAQLKAALADFLAVPREESVRATRGMVTQ